MIVMPQFHLWKVEDDSDYVLDRQGPDGDDDSFDELDIITRDPDERGDENIVAYDPDKGGDEAGIIAYGPDEGEEEANESFVNPDLSTSTIYTEGATNPMERIPDFAIIHLLAQSLARRHPRFAELGGVHIIHQCCVVLVEVKPHPSRTANRREHLHNRDLLLSQAQEDLGVQCYVLFEQYPHALATIYIAAAGQYWTHRVVRRHEVPSLDVSDPDMLDDKEWVRLVWPRPVVIQHRDSDERLREIRNVLEQKPALHLDGNHQ